MGKNDVLASAFWETEPDRGELRVEKLPPLAAGALRVRTVFSAVSRGTESLVFRGAVPVSEHQRMRCPFQAGEFPRPVKYGFCSVVVVTEGPSDLRDRLVFCLHPHQISYQVPVDAVHLLPEGLPAKRGVLAANMETAVKGSGDAAPRIGDRTLVIGAGTLGCLVARLAARIPGRSVELIDINMARAAVAARLGVSFATPAEATREADLVVNTSGSPAGLVNALDVAAFAAKVLEMSWYSDREVALPLGREFHSRRRTLCASRVGTIAYAQGARWYHKRWASTAWRKGSDRTIWAGSRGA